MWHRVAVVTLWLLPSCTKEARPTTEDCSALIEAAEHERAAQVCAQQYTRTHDPALAEAAMRAHFTLHHDDQVLRWSETLRSTDHAATGWAFAAMVYERRNECTPQIEAYEHARKGFEARGELAKAARAAQGQAHCHWRRSELRLAMEAADRALGYARDSGSSSLELQFTLDLVALLSDAADLAAIRWVLGRARKLLPDDDPEARARLLLAEGNLRFAEGHQTLASQSYQQTLSLAAHAPIPEIARLARLNLIEVDLRQGNVSAAAAQLAALEAELGTTPDNPWRRTALRHHRACVAAAEGRDEDALAILDEALTEPELDPEWQWKLHHERGRLWARHGELDRARAELEAAIAVIERLRGELGLEVFKEGLLAQRRGPYESLFALEANAAQVEAALMASERARARAFLDAIATERAPIETDTLDVDQVVGRFDDLRGLLSRGGVTAPAPTTPWPTIQSSIDDLHVLVYFQAHDAMFVFAVHHGHPRLQRLTTSVDRLEQLVSEWTADLDDPQRSRAVADAILPPALRPPRGHALTLVVDGPAERIPFAGLRTDRFLVEDHALTYSPSLTVLARRRAGLTAPATARSSKPPVVLGDSTGELPAAAAESREVAAQVGTHARLGAHADRAALLASSGAPLLHVAVHGGLDSRGAWLQLADGRLRAFEILDQGLAPATAVLVSCASAARHGRGLWGSIAAAFFASGANAVVATAWSVDDRATQRFVRAFYDAHGVEQPAQAIATSQRSFIAAGEPISTWGAFVVLGAPPSSIP